MYTGFEIPLAPLVIGSVIGDERLIKKEQLSLLPHAGNVIPVLKPYKLTSREFKNADTIVSVDGVQVGGKGIAIIAGPCSVESEEQLMTTAEVEFVAEYADLIQVPHGTCRTLKGS